MPWFSVYGSVRQAIQDLVAPEIQKLHGEIKRMEGKFDGKFEGVEGKLEGLDGKLEGLRSEMNTRFEAVDRRFESLEETVKDNSRKVDSFIEERAESYTKSMDRKWHEAMDIHERLAALEAKLETR